MLSISYRDVIEVDVLNERSEIIFSESRDASALVLRQNSPTDNAMSVNLHYRNSELAG